MFGINSSAFSMKINHLYKYLIFLQYVMGPTYVPGPPPQYYLHQRQMIIQDTMVWNERLRDLVVKIRSKFNFN
jgi:hypothetical protein